MKNDNDIKILKTEKDVGDFFNSYIKKNKLLFVYDNYRHVNRNIPFLKDLILSDEKKLNEYKEHINTNKNIIEMYSNDPFKKIYDKEIKKNPQDKEFIKLQIEKAIKPVFKFISDNAINDSKLRIKFYQKQIDDLQNELDLNLDLLREAQLILNYINKNYNISEVESELEKLDEDFDCFYDN